MSAHGEAQRLFQLGLGHHQAGRFADAERLYREVLDAQPAHLAALSNLGMVLGGLGRLDEARTCLLHVLAVRAGDPDALLALARLEQQCGMPAEARGYYDRALAARPEDLATLNDSAVLLNEMCEHEEAVARLRRAIVLWPHDVDAAYNLAFVLQSQGRCQEALERYDALLGEAPEHGEAAWGRALTLLAMGDFARGWPAYEVRYSVHLAAAVASRPELSCPMWQGEPLAGKRILLVGEQGAGDQIQFVRYAALLAAQGAQVDLLTDPRLQRLFANVRGIRRVLTGVAADTSDYDYWALLLSLPLRAGTRMESIPGGIPYLGPAQADVRKWAGQLRALPRGQRKVGLVWESGPATLAWMQHRSMALGVLAPLARMPGISFVDIQFRAEGSPADEADGGFPALHLGRSIGDFADNAALIANLDLLITVDTASAHLGGALGIPTWILLPAVADWRWMRDREDSPWYPTVRLLRQERLGDWKALVERVAHRLEHLPAAQPS